MHELGYFLLCCCLLSYVKSSKLPDVEKRFIFHHHHHSAPVVCKPPAIPNGHLKCPATTYPEGTVCTVICNKGSSHHGNTTIKCHSGVWSTGVTCVPIMCVQPAPFKHGKAVCTNALTVNGVTTKVHKYGAHCRVTCDKGFKPSHLSVSCLSPYKWSGAVSCLEIICSSPPKETHGSFKCSTRTHKLGTTCSLSCSHGYRPSNSHTTITCSADSKWSTSAKCIEIHCPTPSAVSHGSYHCSSTSVHKEGSTCSLKCASGYKASNTHTTINCLSTSKWSGSASCIEVRCPTPAVSHGTFHCASSIHRQGSTCSLKCATGFKPSNTHTTVTCLYTSKWSTPASCIEIKCPAPPKVSLGSYHCTSSTTHKLNEVCHLQCSSGYKPSTTRSNIKCLSSDHWSTPATCVEIKCPAPPKVAHGSYHCVSSTTHKLNDVCHLQCSTGYKPHTTKPDITCLASDAWSSPSTCVEIKCPAPPHVTNGVYHCASATTHKLNDVCQLQCTTGYKPNTSKSNIKCLSSDHWSTPAACVEVKCPAPPKVSHGSYHCSSSTTHKLNELCHLQCLSGYKPSTTKPDIKCLSSDHWSTPAACVEIKCPAPPKVSHGSYHCSSSTTHRLNDVCHLQCLSGYKPSTTKPDIKCQSSDQWSTPTVCVEIKCPAPPKVAHGSYHCSSSTSHKLNDVCHLQCSTGYKPHTAKSDITCLASDAWSGPSTCVEIKCPAPPKVAQGSYHCSSATTHKLNDICHLQCSTGYKPHSAKSDISCLSSDAWSIPSACVEIKCPDPPKVIHGSYHCASSTTHKLNDVCHLQCSSGYKPSTTKPDIKCQSSDHWSAPATCVEIKCPAPPHVTNGLYNCSSSTSHGLNDVCHLQCSTGYKPHSAKSDITCLSSDAWSTPSTCVEIRCPPPPKVSNGSYICGNSTTHKLNEVCHLHCSNGYKPSTVKSDIKCLSSDSWSAPSACAEIKCPAPPKVIHGTYHCVSPTTHKFNDVCHLQCLSGYKPSTPRSHIKCLSSDLWSAPSVCVEIKCPVPLKVTHGLYICGNSTTHKLNDLCHLQCSNGYKPSTVKSDIKCLSSDSWSAPSACVEKRCPKPPLVTNGSYVCNQTVYTPNSECTLKCDHGFKPGNISVITCNNNETWSIEDDCTEIICPPPSSIPNGAYICQTNSSIYTLDMTCNVQCDPGYTPTSTQSIQCMEEEEWSKGSLCVDTTAPRFTYCPSNQRIVLETGERSTGVTWSEPKATDVPESNPVNVTLMSIFKSGSEFQIGKNTVTYMAVDKSGNTATCSFFVYITSGCPKGSFFYKPQQTCIICPAGTYQDETTLKCVPCPSGLFTASEGSFGSDSCREYCEPGSSSSDGLQPCSPCAVGSFQWSQGSKTCDLCPQGQTTKSEGSIEIQDCMTL